MLVFCQYVCLQRIVTKDMVYKQNFTQIIMEFFSEIDMDVQNMNVFIAGWGYMRKNFCVGSNEGPKAAHICNKWFVWNSK